jgi:hypothetical protein
MEIDVFFCPPQSSSIQVPSLLFFMPKKRGKTRENKRNKSLSAV